MAVRTFAERTNTGVLNTWGLKGLFAWDSPFHLGTAGLQERDFELAGVHEVDEVIGVGLDEDESPRELLGPLSETTDLDGLAARLGRAPQPPERSRLYATLSAVAGPLYADESVPRNPARASADLAAALPPGGLVTADPGPAGLWIARTFPTTELGSVLVPARRSPAAAVTFACVGARQGRPTIAVTTYPLDDATSAAIDAARSEGLSFVVAVWGADDIGVTVEAALAQPGVTIVPMPVDFSATRALVEVAGPVRAWT